MLVALFVIWAVIQLTILACMVVFLRSMFKGVVCSSKAAMILALCEFRSPHYTSGHFLFSPDKAGLYSFIGCLECVEYRCKKSKGQDVRGLGILERKRF